MRACVYMCVDHRFTSHRALHFTANRFNFTFSIELYLSLFLALRLPYDSRLFVFAVCLAVCLDCIFMATAQIHRQDLRRIN